MWWIALWTVVTAVGVLGTVVSANSVRFARRVAQEARELAAVSGNPPPVTPALLSDLPRPVQRYLAKAIQGNPRAVRLVRLRHAGTFRPSLSGSWLPVRGEQHFTADPPGFVWWGRVRIAPGLWIDARDRSVKGLGNMFVTAASTFTLANSTGPELDQGALLRLLGEMAWFPTAFLDSRYVRWSAIDDHAAGATLRVNGRSVTGEFRFGADDLPTTFTADRYRDVGGGRNELTPFVGTVSDFRPVDGLLVPHRVVGAWVVEGNAIEYVDFRVQELEFVTSEQ